MEKLGVSMSMLSELSCTSGLFTLYNYDGYLLMRTLGIMKFL